MQLTHISPYLEMPILRLNLSLLLQSHFDSLME